MANVFRQVVSSSCWLKKVRGMLGLNDEFSRIKNMYCIVLHPRTKFFFLFIFYFFYIYIYIFIFVLTNAGASCMYICVWV